MINPNTFLKNLATFGISFFCGVPDSLLKHLCACISDTVPPRKQMITANEGSAIGLATGYHLATGKRAAVYMQNSGFGNALNPLLSLADSEIYAIPMLLIIGWRGEPGVKDEPQHLKQGRVQTALLEAAEIPYRTMDADSDPAALLKELLDHPGPVALLVRKGTFSEYPMHKATSKSPLTREKALGLILREMPDWRIVSTTGKTSRELYELRGSRGEEQRDFLTVGSMGHSSAIALGLAISRPDESFICLDGDGALLMHTGIMSNIGKAAPSNLLHILLNNRCHESVGGQSSAADTVDFAALSRAMAYPHYLKAESSAALISALRQARELTGPIFLEIVVKPGSRTDLGRPQESPAECKQRFMLSGDNA